MAKGFKLRLSLPSIRICRSKKPSSMPKSPSKSPAPMFTPFNQKMFDITYPKLPAPPSTPNHPFLKLKMLPLMSGCTDSPALPRLCNSPVSEDLEEFPWPVSFSSADGGQLSTDQDRDDKEESEGILSSCSSFDSSSDFGYALKTNNEAHAYGNKRTNKNKKARKSMKHYDSNSWKDGEKTTMATLPEDEPSSSPAKKTAFERLMPCMVDGKVNESYAVMKKSEDPYDDFKKSMMEMILEKHLSESKDLEDLLMCFLSLNARDHHVIIVEAFGEVWKELFAPKS